MPSIYKEDEKKKLKNLQKPTFTFNFKMHDQDEREYEMKENNQLIVNAQNNLMRKPLTQERVTIN